MEIRSFWGSHPLDYERLDNTVLVVPDLALSVRDILTRFTAGQLQLNEIETGEDEDFDTPSSSFEDLVDASEAYRQGVEIVNEYQNRNVSLETSVTPSVSDTSDKNSESVEDVR